MGQNAAARMTKHRADMKARGFKPLNTHVPEPVARFIEEERQRRRVMSKGDALAAMVAELQAYRERKQEERPSG